MHSQSTWDPVVLPRITTLLPYSLHLRNHIWKDYSCHGLNPAWRPGEHLHRNSGWVRETCTKLGVTHSIPGWSRSILSPSSIKTKTGIIIILPSQTIARINRDYVHTVTQYVLCIIRICVCICVCVHTHTDAHCNFNVQNPAVSLSSLTKDNCTL